MKKIIGFICITIMLLSMSITVFAGSIPEDLLHSDEAQVFFAEVLAYHPNKEKPVIEFSPVKKIKGDVKLDTKQSAYYFNTIGDFDIKEGNVYLFTYFDENNPTDIFEVTSCDTSTLKLKNVSGDMWERFEDYLNEGRYLDAEYARIDRQNEKLPVDGESISFAELIGVPKEKAEKINISYNGEVYEIDVNDFYRAIEDIVLTDIKDVSLEKTDGEKISFPSGMYITVNGFDGYAFITDDCKVDKYGMHLSSMPSSKYTIKFVDRAKIMGLFAYDEYDLPFLETPPARKLFYLIGIIPILTLLCILFGYFIFRKKNNCDISAGCKNKSWLMLIVIISCIIMAITETIIEPAYFIKSALKIVFFLVLPLCLLKPQKEKVFADAMVLNKKTVLKLLALGLGVYAVIMVAYLLTKRNFNYPTLVNSLSIDQNVSPSSFIWVAIYISFCNSFLEEFLFRYIGFIKLSKYTTKKVAYMFSSSIFALYHIAMIGSSFPLPLLLISLIGLAIGGGIFDYVDDKNGNIYNSWIIHMFADFAIMTIWYIYI